MTVIQAIEELREHVQSLRNNQSLRTTASAIGIGVNQLGAFLHGDSIALTTLHKIAEWCDKNDPPYAK